MKIKKKVMALVVAIGILGAAGTAYAADFKTPGDIVAGLTGKTAAEVNVDRATGKTYGEIANEAGKLDEFKLEMIDQKKATLDQRVKDGSLTQEQADNIYNAMKNNLTTCDGTGNAQIGKMYGAGFGNGAMMGMGRGQGQGRGMGRGAGMGTGFGIGNNI